MNISLKLPVAFAATCGLMFAGGLFGIYRLNTAVASFQGDVMQHVSANQSGAEVSNALATGVQEWKNVLLRGKTPKDLDKH